jgi:hypothetical protein
MSWKGDDTAIKLVLIRAPKYWWIMLFDHEKVLCHLFFDQVGLVSSPTHGMLWAPTLARPQPRRPPWAIRP